MWHVVVDTSAVHFSQKPSLFYCNTPSYIEHIQLVIHETMYLLHKLGSSSSPSKQSGSPSQT